VKTVGFIIFGMSIQLSTWVYCTPGDQLIAAFLSGVLLVLGAVLIGRSNRD
jgi:hypothetical protein